MDTNIDDKMYHQIEKNLSNTIDDNLFTTGRVLFNDNKSVMGNTVFDNHNSNDIEVVSKEYGEEWHAQVSIPQLPRAEYIRLAREACLRQMSAQSLGSNYETYDMEPEIQSIDLSGRKKPRALKLFHDGNLEAENGNNTTLDGNTPQELAAFQSLIIRIICAFVLFISIFIINKFELKYGKINPQIIKEYVVGNDSLKVLEDIIVTWLK